jgi:hypothetical protein
VNEAKTAAFPIVARDGRTFVLAGGRGLRAAFRDADSDGHTMFHVCDFKVGDAVRIPAIVSVTRKRIGEYEVHSTVPANVTIPIADASVYLVTPDGTRKRLAVAGEGGAIRVAVSSALLR